ncbi:hypothetical protein DRQ53_08550 [bacterium]|nr:MAG: hypothetical protein DRQ32_05085 [bacterium]RKZ15627.1 MAG: hypothetical protein DRQ53_08550 [bacterium]
MQIQKRWTINLLVIFVLLAAQSAFAQFCEEYDPGSTVPKSGLGLFDGYNTISIATKSDYVYIFDGTDNPADLPRLDCLSLTDPYNMEVVVYEPVIHIDPKPYRLLKIGADRLYAYHSGGVSIIDISVPTQPTMVTTVPYFGGGTYLGALGDHAFFLKLDHQQIWSYSFVDPDAPALVSMWDIPIAEGFGPYFSDAADLVGSRIYLSWNDMNGTNLAVVDATNPVALATTLHYHAGVVPQPWEYEQLQTPFGSNMIRVFEDELVFSLSVNIGPDDYAAYDLVDPDHPMPTAYDGLAWKTHSLNGVDYGIETDPMIPHESNVHLGDGVLWRRFEGSGLAFTDHAVLWTQKTIYADFDYIYAAPRQCDNSMITPAIIQGSLSHTYGFQGNDDLTVNWRTNVWTDPQLDQIVVSDGRRNPPAAQIGTVTVTGGDIPVLQPDGTWLHAVTYTFANCVPKSSYNYSAQSQVGSQLYTVTGGLLKRLVCMSLGNGLLSDEGSSPSVTLSLGAYPNPFNPSTTLSFSVPASARTVTLDIYSVDGRHIASLYRGNGADGVITRSWNGRDDAGRPVSSGVFFARVVADDNATTRKLVMLK